MKHLSNESTQPPVTLETDSFVSLKDYLGREEASTNPYASIDDFLDDTWNLNLTSTPESQASIHQSNPS